MVQNGSPKLKSDLIKSELLTHIAIFGTIESHFSQNGFKLYPFSLGKEYNDN